MRSILSSLALVVVSGCAAAPGAPPPEADDSDPASVPSMTLDVRAIPADVPEGAAIAMGDVSVMAPAPGETAGMVVHAVDGTSATLSVARAIDGSVTVHDLGSGPLSVESATRECTDGAYALEGFKWKVTLAWWFRASTTPSDNSVGAVEAALVRAANDVTTARNKCGLADQVSATHAYKGRTSRATNVSSTTTTITCGKPDGVNVVAFGGLPQRYLGVTCYWYDGNKAALEADVKLNARYHKWFAAAQVPVGCTSRFGVEAVAVHELGHAFGLGHVSETTHGELTMSTATGPCTLAPATLGLGDVKGLRALY